MNSFRQTNVVSRHMYFVSPHIFQPSHPLPTYKPIKVYRSGLQLRKTQIFQAYTAKMRQQITFARAIFTSALLSVVIGRPAPVDKYESDPGGSPTAAVIVPNPPSASGSLRGSLELGGYNPANVISTETTVIPPSEFQLAPGQSEKADLGLYLDLTSVKNPQPIRGSTNSPTDPGPRKSSVS